MPCLIDVASDDGKLFGDDGIDVEDEVVFENADYTDLSARQAWATAVLSAVSFPAASMIRSK